MMNLTDITGIRNHLRENSGRWSINPAIPD